MDPTNPAPRPALAESLEAMTDWESPRIAEAFRRRIHGICPDAQRPIPSDGGLTHEAAELEMFDYLVAERTRLEVGDAKSTVLLQYLERFFCQGEELAEIDRGLLGRVLLDGEGMEVGPPGSPVHGAASLFRAVLANPPTGAYAPLLDPSARNALRALRSELRSTPQTAGDRRRGPREQAWSQAWQSILRGAFSRSPEWRAIMSGSDRSLKWLEEAVLGATDWIDQHWMEAEAEAFFRGLETFLGSADPHRSPNELLPRVLTLSASDLAEMWEAVMTTARDEMLAQGQAAVQTLIDEWGEIRQKWGVAS